MQSKKNKAKPFGYELLLDCYDCDPKIINSIDACAQFLEDLTAEIGMLKQSPPFIFQSPKEYPEKAGLSGWIPIIESGIQVHTLTVTRFVSLDVYSCKKFDLKKVKFSVRKFLRCKKIETQYIERGKNYEEVIKKYRQK